MSDINTLKTGFGFVSYTYSDGSKLVFRTTLNTELLLDEGVKIKSTELYDFDRKKIIAIPSDITILISKERPDMTEVDKFANLYLW